MLRILSLFDYTGHWPAPWVNAGYKLTQLDLMLGHDILRWKYKHFKPGHFDIILSAPPCTCFSHASSQSWCDFDLTGQTQFSILLVKKSLEIINYFQPRVWAIENPTGRLDKLLPELKKFRLLHFHPWQFGDPFFKHTVLWGIFNPFLIQSPVQAYVYVNEKKGRMSYSSYYRNLFPKRSRAFYRSITPAGFARAFFEANKPS